MKLFTYTFSRISLLLVILISIWGVFFYLTILDEVIDETDDSLANYKAIIIRKVLIEPEIMYEQPGLIGQYTFRKLTPDEANKHKERYYNSTVYMETEDEYEPVRVLETSFRAADGEYYELRLMMLTFEKDDMIRKLFFYIALLYLLFFLFSLWGTRLILKRAFHPLNRLLEWLNLIQPGKEVPGLSNETHIMEFNKLNGAALSLAYRARKAYLEQKTFIENASHELQTPLAIIQGKVDMLAEDENLTEQQGTGLNDIYITLSRAIKLNRSLLLLSRIENGQYPGEGSTEANKVVRELVKQMEELYGHKEVKVQLADKTLLILECNEELIYILFSNLIRNAFIHSPGKGVIRIDINSSGFVITNPGDQPLDEKLIFHRFYRGNPGKENSTGLGLSIVKAICTVSNLEISYNYKGEHQFVLKKIN